MNIVLLAKVLGTSYAVARELSRTLVELQKQGNKYSKYHTVRKEGYERTKKKSRNRH